MAANSIFCVMVICVLWSVGRLGSANKKPTYLSMLISIAYHDGVTLFSLFPIAGRPGSSEVPRNPLTRWDVSSIPANGIFLTKKLKNKIKMPNGWRTVKSLIHKIRFHSRRGKGMVESFSREKLRHAAQKEDG